MDTVIHRRIMMTHRHLFIVFFSLFVGAVEHTQAKVVFGFVIWNLTSILSLKRKGYHYISSAFLRTVWTTFRFSGSASNAFQFQKTTPWDGVLNDSSKACRKFSVVRFVFK